MSCGQLFKIRFQRLGKKIKETLRIKTYKVEYERVMVKNYKATTTVSEDEFGNLSSEDYLSESEPEVQLSYVGKVRFTID